MDVSRLKPFDLAKAMLCEPVVLVYDGKTNGVPYVYVNTDTPFYANGVLTRNLIFRPLIKPLPVSNSINDWSVGAITHYTGDPAIRVSVNGLYLATGLLKMAPKTVKKTAYVHLFVNGGEGVSSSVTWDIRSKESLMLGVYKSWTPLKLNVPIEVEVQED